MKNKTRLNLDELTVDSFFVTAEPKEKTGTVFGYLEGMDGMEEMEGVELGGGGGGDVDGETAFAERTIVRTCKATCCKTCGYTCDGSFTCGIYSVFTACPDEAPISSK